jgi:hypothetical protein
VLRPRRPWLPATVITLLSGTTGGWLGLLSNVFYVGEMAGGRGPARRVIGLDVGAVLGMAAGLAVGVAWCWFMFQRGDAARRRGASGGLLGPAIGGGLAAGSVAALLLHAGMQVVYGSDAPLLSHFWGQVFGILSGGLVGLVGGLIWPSASPGALEP